MITNMKDFLTEQADNYRTWKRKNVTLRGMRELGEENNGSSSYGRGLYTTPLSNKKMAKEYGDVYFVVNAIPKIPKIVDSVNHAEMFIQSLVDKFCKTHNKDYSVRFFNENTTIEKEMIKLGYDGMVIKGREMVNYLPEDILFFKTENELENYYYNNY